MPDRFIYTTDDTLRMLDQLLADRGDRWWNGFFADRARPCPFLVDWPDENLVEWFDQGRLQPGRVLELGCGHGRNAAFLAGRGCRVDAVDFSAEAIGWAEERTRATGVQVDFQCCDIFDATIADGSYDLVYDSGCFHHLAPHRRQDYVDLVSRALAPGGRFALVCFRPEGGSVYTDQQVYENRSLGGGLGYSEDRLRQLWDDEPYSIDVLRPMTNQDGQGPVFGADFLWALLATKRDGPLS
jgi:SAM-dependent methyltransferase